MELAKWLVAFVATFNFGGLVADAIVPSTARQHLWNPAWKPHAKFHNAQTMTLGLLNGSIALVILFGAQPLTLPLFLIAAALASNYFLALLLASLFPGVAWVDPEFDAETPRPLGLPPQMLVSLLLCGLVTIALASAILSG